MRKTQRFWPFLQIVEACRQPWLIVYRANYSFISAEALCPSPSIEKTRQRLSARPDRIAATKSQCEAPKRSVTDLKNPNCTAGLPYARVGVYLRVRRRASREEVQNLAYARVRETGKSLGVPRFVHFVFIPRFNGGHFLPSTEYRKTHV